MSARELRRHLLELVRNGSEASIGKGLLTTQLSAVLAAAGERCPAPLPIRPTPVWALVLLPPLAMVLVLLAGWALPRQEGESSQSPAQHS